MWTVTYENGDTATVELGIAASLSQVISVAERKLKYGEAQEPIRSIIDPLGRRV